MRFSDSRGIFVNTTSGEYAGKDSIYIGGGRILFTDDNWKTVSEAIGRIDVAGESTFGVIAKAVVAGLIMGSNIVGGNITGTSINNGNGTFAVDENGKLTASSATISGTIKATEGAIGCDANGTGGFIIKSNKIYNGKETFTAASHGIYIGTDGISLGYNSTARGANFSVTNTGELVARSGTIGGMNIGNAAIYSGKTSLTDANAGIYISSSGIALGANNAFKVTNGGYVTASNIDVSGVSTFSSTKASPFGGTAVTHIQSLAVGQLTADNLRAGVAQLGYASIGDLNAVSARVGTVEANYITASQVSASYATITNLNATNATVANKLNTSDLYATIAALNAVFVSHLYCDSYTVNHEGRSYTLSPTNITVGGTTYVVIGARH